MRSEVTYVQPTEWASGRGKGARFRSGDVALVAAWATKSQAVMGARRIGWRAKDVTKIHTRLGGIAYAIVDGRFGFLSRSSYEQIARTALSPGEERIEEGLQYD